MVFVRSATESFVLPGGGGGDSHMKQTGMLVGNFGFTPKGDHLGVAQAPIKETNLGVAKRDLGGIKYWRFSRNILSETKSKIYTPKRDDEHPRLFHMGVPHPGFVL